MKIKTADLTGAALDWAVAKCRGFDGLDDDLWLMREGIADMPLHAYTPSTDWAQGGPIVEREEVDIYCHESPKSGCGWWIAEITGTKHKAKGNTPLIAAMRCYCYTKLGDEVDVPDELA
jgi:hypothetical protein